MAHLWQGGVPEVEPVDHAGQKHVEVLLGKPPARAHPCAVTEGSEDVWMDRATSRGSAPQGRGRGQGF